MKKRLLILVVGLLTLVGCSDSGTSKFKGKWSTNGGDVEFFKDGTYKAGKRDGLFWYDKEDKILVMYSDVARDGVIRKVEFVNGKKAKLTSLTGRGKTETITRKK